MPRETFLTDRPIGCDPERRAELEAFTEAREIDHAGVAALDAALAAVGDGAVTHLVDGRRSRSFIAGGPAAWSVGYVEVGRDLLFVTYGNAEQIEPANRPCSFELTIRVPREAGVHWPSLLLRYLVRTMLVTGRELPVGDYLSLGHPITRVTGPHPELDEFPMSTMSDVFFVPDPLVAGASTPRGPIELRRVVGMFPSERDHMQPWSVLGLAHVMQRKTSTLTTDPHRESFALDPSFVRSMRDGARREGSQLEALAIDGIEWSVSGDRCAITIPATGDARRIRRLIDSRLGFGRTLLIHDRDSARRRTVLLAPSATGSSSFAIDDAMLIVRLSPASSALDALSTLGRGPVIWVPIPGRAVDA